MALRTLPTPFDHSEALAMAELKTSLERVRTITRSVNRW